MSSAGVAVFAALNFVPVTYILLVMRRYDAAFVGYVHFVLHAIVVLGKNLSLFQMHWDTVLRLATTMSNQWLALSVQLMTNELPANRRFVQFILVTTTLNVLGALFTVEHHPYLISAYFSIMCLVVPLNWKLTEQTLPKHPVYYAPLLFMTMTFITYLIVYDISEMKAGAIWELSSSLTTVIISASKKEWTKVKFSRGETSPKMVELAHDQTVSLPTDSDISQSTPLNSLAPVISMNRLA